MSNPRQIIGKSFTYGIGTMLRGLTSFIMLPIYTSHLSPKDYGVIELITVVVDLMILLIGARVAVGIYKLYSDAPTEPEKKCVISTSLIIMIGIHMMAVALIAALSAPIAQLLNASHDFQTALMVYSISAIFGAINEVFFSYLRILDKAKTYVSINIAKLLIQLSLNILLIVYMDFTYWGVIISAVLSSAVISIFFSLWLLPKTGIKFDISQAKRLVKFSYPIILTSLAMYYMTFGDRYFIRYFQGVDAVGIYALAYKFGFLLFAIIASPFSAYWSPKQFDLAKQVNAPQLFGSVFFYTTILMVTVSAGLMATVGEFIHLTAKPEYMQAVPIIPWVLGAYILLFWSDFTRFGFLHTSNTKYLAYGGLATTLLITALYFYFIPKEGALGAAKATFYAFLFRFLHTYYYSQRFFRIEIPWGRVAAVIIYFSTILWLAYQLPITGLIGMIARGIVIAVGFLAIFLTPVVFTEHRKLILQKIAP